MAQLTYENSLFVSQGDTTVERTNEPKIVLLVRLLSAIDEGRFSFEQLKDRISEGEHRPSTRSLRRYLAVLADAGFPWYFDRATNTYRFTDGYSLKRLELSSSELFGLVALRAISASLGGAIGTYVDEVTAKIVGSSGSGASARASAMRGRSGVSVQTGSVFVALQPRAGPQARYADATCSGVSWARSSVKETDPGSRKAVLSPPACDSQRVLCAPRLNF